MKRPAWLAIVAALVAALASGVCATPIEIDTAGAHVIVVRPVDVWSGDEGYATKSLGAVRDKIANYFVVVSESEALYGGPMTFHKMTGHPITIGVKAELQKAGFRITSSEAYRFRVDMPQSLKPDDYDVLREAQSELLRRAVLAQGDPATLQSRVSNHKVVGGLLSLVTLGAAGNVGGATVANATLGSGIAGDVYQAPRNSANRDARRSGIAAEPYQVPENIARIATPALLPAFDTATYAQIEVRRLWFFGGMVGQIVIAYREPKAPEAEVEALVKAIVSAVGADTTPEAIEASRAADLAWRKTQWSECVAAGKCKPSSDEARAERQTSRPRPEGDQ